MLSINRENMKLLLLKLKDLLFQKAIEFLIEKILKIVFCSLLIGFIIFILFHPSISSIYNPRKQIEQRERPHKSIELPITHLIIIKHSPLTISSELFKRLIEYINKAKIIVKSLQILQIRTKSSLDKLITYSVYTLKLLEANEAHNQATTFMENELREMTLLTQCTLRSLTDFDETLVELHDLAMYELTNHKSDYNKLLDSLWSKLGGNSRKIQEYEEHLKLLEELDRRLHTAISYTRATSYKLVSFQLNLDELYKLVSMIEMPINIHIEIIWKGVERLIEGGGDVVLINSIEPGWSNVSAPTLIRKLLNLVNRLYTNFQYLI